MAEHYVKIVETKTKKVVSNMGPMSARQAGRVADGAAINLNWDSFHIEIDPELSDEEPTT